MDGISRTDGMLDRIEPAPNRPGRPVKETKLDSVVRDCDCSTGVRDMLWYSADSSFSSTSYLHVSWDNPSSSCFNGAASEIEDKIENGIIACPEEELMVGQLGRANANRNPRSGILALDIICFFELGHGTGITRRIIKVKRDEGRLVWFGLWNGRD
ncbi:hypothetical protein SADUNF_Sadunf16G0029600 [Salix dunnii]|uniref:Uncharacterized protein n=1 Tax=Salix dunnii TaxID=1413687 RepID=A0A835J6P6_9ROSI|nr:hypothetical protein SADUNF_Sadunf16G0029600 [Salix dunnii]